MEFEIGMKVRVRDDLVADQPYGAEWFVGAMEQYKGVESTIVHIQELEDGTVLTLLVTNVWRFTPEMVIPI